MRAPLIARLDARRHASRTGAMNDPDWAIGLFEGHLGRLLRHGGKLQTLRSLELGPGNSLAQSILFYLLGAKEVISVDVRRYATEETGEGVYRRLVERMEGWLTSQTLAPEIDSEQCRLRQRAILPESADFPILSETFRYEITDGLCLPLPDARVDFVFSTSVLEHVADVATTYRELWRVLRPGGLMSHQIDLRDHHRTEPFDFLRYGDRLWSWMQGRSAGFTNRLRASDHLREIETVGFEILSTERQTAGSAPPRSELASRFRSYPDKELRTLTLTVTARRPGEAIFSRPGARAEEDRPPS